jgi:6-pyruvoyltetrahydropterin/6-carboxytetrahydropterin synthase
LEFDKGGTLEIFKVFTIDAAHRLPHVPDGHKCGRLHGHTFQIEVHIQGPLDPQFGWIIDFADVKSAFRPIEDQLDHHYLNEVAGLENPTSENIARWVYENLKPALPGLSKIVIRETCSSGCIYTGEPEA